MRISFFGHRDIINNEELKNRLFSTLKENITEDCELLFGGYGAFDSLAYECASRLDIPYNIKKIFVTPYISESYLKNQVEYIKNQYDAVIYPEIENTPYRFAISARNKWMAEQSDLVICYVNRAYGGAYQVVKNRKIKKKINLGTFTI